MSRLAKITDWYKAFSKAFITQVSTGDGEYFIKVKFKTMAEMHDAYGAMADLAKVAEPLSRASLPNTTGEAE